MEEREEGLRRERSHRILVTGSRGKSSLVRLLCAGLEACGVSPWGRITGVLPRQIGPGGERLIERTAPAHVEEMRELHLDVPHMADLAHELREEGMPLPEGILTVEEMAQEVVKLLCPSKSNT